MEKIGIDLNHFILYLDDLTKRQQTFLMENFELRNKLKNLVSKNNQNENEEFNKNVQQKNFDSDQTHTNIVKKTTERYF